MAFWADCFGEGREHKPRLRDDRWWHPGFQKSRAARGSHVLGTFASQSWAPTRARLFPLRRLMTVAVRSRTALSPAEDIIRTILVLPGRRVIVDRHLAAICGVDARTLNQAAGQFGGRILQITNCDLE